MSVKLIIDHRECKLKDIFVSNDNVEYENLPLGDIHIVIDGNPVYIFERKCLSDLLASVNDGRYKNQKLKLLETYGVEKIFYIIEGRYDFTEHNTTDKTIHGVVINTLLRDHIGIFNTSSVRDTANLIQCMFDRINKDPKKYIQTKVKEEELFIRKLKGGSCFKAQLCQVPDISSKTADAIVNRYGSLLNMFKELSMLSAADQLSALKEISTVDANGKKRKISSKAVDNIVTFMLQEAHDHS